MDPRVSTSCLCHNSNEKDADRLSDKRTTFSSTFQKSERWAFPAGDPTSRSSPPPPPHTTSILNLWFHTRAIVYWTSTQQKMKSELSVCCYKVPSQPFFVRAFTFPVIVGGGQVEGRGLINPFLHLLRLPQCSPLLPPWKANMGNLWKKVARESQLRPLPLILHQRGSIWDKQTNRFLTESPKTGLSIW